MPIYTEKELLDMYQEYAFLPDDAERSQDAGDAEVEANSIMDRTYEAPYKWYYIVFKPFDAPYAKDADFFKVKGLDKCRKMFKKPQALILTREILNCEKVHINALVCTDQDLLLRHNKSYCNKYKLHVSLLSEKRDRLNVLSYILKELKERSFLKYLDYYTFIRK